MPVRMKDIAQELGLSVATISKVLRNHPDIKEETRQWVLSRMKELNYRPNLVAQSMTTGKTFTLGLIVPDLLHPFFARIAKSLSNAVRDQNYSLLISSSDEDEELERREIDRMLAHRVDTLLIASTQQQPGSFAALARQKTPFILLDRQFEDFPANFIGMDDRAIGAMATQHLMEQGCKVIAHLGGPPVSTALGRYRGYQDTLRQAGLPVRSDLYVSLGRSGDHLGEESGYLATKTLLAGNPLPDGIFCFNDPSAFGAMRALLEANLRIPEDIAVIGCGNILNSDLLRVPLSTIDQNSDEIGKQAALMALQLIAEDEPAPPRRIVLSPTLVARASTGKQP